MGLLVSEPLVASARNDLEAALMDTFGYETRFHNPPEDAHRDDLLDYLMGGLGYDRDVANAALDQVFGDQETILRRDWV